MERCAAPETQTYFSFPNQYTVPPWVFCKLTADEKHIIHLASPMFCLAEYLLS